MRVAYATFGPTGAGPGIVRPQRFERPPGAVAFQLTCYPPPAAATPSALQHLLINGTADTQATFPVWDLTASMHYAAQWDFLENPNLYGTWIPLPPVVNAIEVVDGQNPGCIGLIERGTVTWLIGDDAFDPWRNN